MLASPSGLSVAALFCSLALSATALAEPFYVVAHPKTGLTAKDTIYDKDSDTWYIRSLTAKNPEFVSAQKPSQAPGGQGFILFLEPPRTEVIARSPRGTPPGGDMRKWQEFQSKDVVAVQPFSLYFRAEAKAEPVLLGEGFVWGRASQLHFVDKVGGISEYKITNETPEAMTGQIVRDKVPNIPRLVSHALAPHIIASPSQPRSTVDSVLAWAKRIPAIETPADKTILKPPPTESELQKTIFRPSRVKKDAAGNLLVEVDLHNKLPVRVAGVMGRSPSKPERDLHQALISKIPKIQDRSPINRKFSDSASVEFVIGPNEKAVATFVIPQEIATDPASIMDNEIVLALHGLGQMADEVEKAGRARSARKKPG